jgi:hypothetical protein
LKSPRQPEASTEIEARVGCIVNGSSWFLATARQRD